MPCVTIHDENGKPIGHARVRHAARKICPFCRLRYATNLCDFPIGRNKTCDKGICDSCATSKGPDIDYCPTHKKYEPQQQRLFGE